LLEKPDAVVYNGYDEMIALGLLYGAKGSIGTWSNLFPGMYTAIFKCVQEGRGQQAVEIQLAFTNFLNLAWKHGVIDVFEELMNIRDYAPRCFRKPHEWHGRRLGADVVRELGLLEKEIDRLVEVYS